MVVMSRMRPWGEERGRTDRGRGFTLVDMVVAVMVLTLGILGLAGTVGVVGAQMRAARVDTQLAALARGEMERHLAAGYGSLGMGEEVRGPYRIVWEVRGEDPSELRLIVRYQEGTLGRADTIATLVTPQR